MHAGSALGRTDGGRACLPYRPDGARPRALAPHHPTRFVFAAKASRYITHIKKLEEPTDALERFFAPLAPLRPKLDVVLWQLPPRFDVDALRRALGEAMCLDTPYPDGQKPGATP